MDADPPLPEIPDMSKSHADLQTPFLDYYKKHDIIPVNQAPGHLEALFARRTALHRHLGITGGNVQGRRVIEFGPGSGDNAAHVAHFKPAKLVLVDANPASIRALDAKRKEGLLGADCEICDSDILGYRSDQKFDLVICEGTIPGQRDPSGFLRHVASFADSGGIVSVTVVSDESFVAEVCRCALVPLLVKPGDDQQMKVERLTEFFRPDLLSLKGMTRRHEDWVLDTLLHPWSLIGEMLPADQAIDALADEFSLLGASPRFLQDWRWYKAVPANRRSNADHMMDEYRNWSIYLLDYRVQPERTARALAPAVASHAKGAIGAFNRIQEASSAEPAAYEALLDALGLLGEAIAEVMPLTSRSIADYARGLRALLAGDAAADFGSFRSWFGRGQQYLSFVRA
jgi:ubiquinone/menaquinone biosynthesis C-methylase UbiE